MGERETVRRQLKVAFMTMMEGAGYVDDEGRDGGFDLEERGQQGMHHSCPADFIIPKDGRSVKREERWRETLNIPHVTFV